MIFPLPGGSFTRLLRECKAVTINIKRVSDEMEVVLETEDMSTSWLLTAGEKRMFSVIYPKLLRFEYNEYYTVRREHLNSCRIFGTLQYDLCIYDHT